MSIATVVNWCNKGWLQSQRTAGGHRRIALDELVRFSRERGYALPSELQDVLLPHPVPARSQVLLIHGQHEFAKVVREFLALDGQVDVAIAEGPLQIGFALGSRSPQVVVLDLELREPTPAELVALPWPEGLRPVLLGARTFRGAADDALVARGLVADVLEQTTDAGAFARQIASHLPARTS